MTMAESEYSRSVLGASDEVRDIYYEPCHQAGHVAIAEGYCEDCHENVCGPCHKSHQQHKALANKKDSMPMVTDSSKRVIDVCETKCTIHQNNVIELFCETCDKLVCTICVATDHQKCYFVRHISDIVIDPEDPIELDELDEAFEEYNDALKSIANTLSECNEKLQAHIASNKDMRTLAKQELKHRRDEINRFFYQLEEKMDEQITDIEKRNRDTLKAASDRLGQVKTDLNPLKMDIEAKNTAQRCELFIAIKQNMEKLMTFDDQFDRLQQELRIQHYTLVPSEEIQAMMRTTSEICRIATAIFDSEIDVTTTYKSNSICGLTIMHGLYCVASDYFHKTMKVIDTKSNKCVISEIAIEAEYIYSMTSVSDDQVAVSVQVSHGKFQMQFFTVSASGVIQRTNQLYDVNDWYFTMVHSAGNIYGVKYQRIDKLDMTGKMVRTIHTDDTGRMYKIALGLDGQTLYVTDHNKNSVTSMTLGCP